MFNDENEISGGQLLSLDASFSGDEEAEEVRDHVIWLGLGMWFFL